MNRIKVHLTGPFKVQSAAGQDITPRGAKETALIALLLRSNTGERARGWIQAKLWSDRGKEQAAASLRQAVSKVRKSLLDSADLISSDRRTVAIDLERIDVIEDPNYEFLEGIDVRDEEFEYWLTTERSALESKGSVQSQSSPIVASGLFKLGKNLAPPSCIHIQSIGDKSSSSWWLERFFSDSLTRTLSETFSMPVIEKPIEQFGQSAWRLEVSAFESGPGKHGVRAALFAGEQQHKIWSTFRLLGGDHHDYSSHPELLVAAQELSGVISEKLSNEVSETEVYTDPNALSSIAIAKLFTMQAPEVAEADRLFEHAFELRPRGLYLAWRAKVRQVQYIERLRSDLSVAQDECETFIRRAMDLEPRNSTVLSILSYVRLFFDEDIGGAADYAKRSVKANPGNPMAWWAYSAVQIDVGDMVSAYECSHAAVDLAQGTPLEFWAKSQLSGAAIAMRKLDEAKSLFKTVSFGRPEFRPPLRYLVALHATHEEWELALNAAQKLKRREPDFSVDRMLNDGAYPAALLRASVGLDRDRIRSLI